MASLLSVLALAPGSAAAASAGDLDPTFGTGGVAVVPLPGNQYIRGVGIPGDGTIVIGGSGQASATATQNDFAAMRLTSAGALDTQFGPANTGYAFPSIGTYATASDMVVQPDGKILLSGDVGPGPNYDLTVARVTNPGGVLDTTYGGGFGWSRADISGSEYGADLLQQPDGRILVSGYNSPSAGSSPAARNMVLARLLNPQGTFDSSFGGGDGRDATDFGGVESSTHLGLQSDGKILVGGTTTPAADGVNPSILITRRPASGVGVDPTFGDGTKRILDGRGLSALLVQPDDKILVLSTVGGEDSADVTLRRLLPNGADDPSFAAGQLRMDFGAADRGSAMALQPDGAIVIVGASRSDGTATPVVARVTANGALDTTFGQGGIARPALGLGAEILAVAIAGDGNIIVAGTSKDGSVLTPSDAMVARLRGASDPVPVPPVEVVKCGGRKATVVGTPKADKLKGTKRADVIAGLGGNDKIKGLGGNDLICGGAGKDVILGGKGKDRLLGEAGRDTLVGGAGKDKLNGGAGKDRQKQ